MEKFDILRRVDYSDVNEVLFVITIIIYFLTWLPSFGFNHFPSDPLGIRQIWRTPTGLTGLDRI